MLAKIKRIFVILSMISITIVVVGFYTAICISNYRQVRERSDFFTQFIIENNGSFPEYNRGDDDLPRGDILITPETRFSTRYAVICLNDDDVITHADFTNIASISVEEAEQISEEILSKDRPTGYYDNFRYRIGRIKDEKVIVLVDINEDMSYLEDSTRQGILILIIGLACVFIILNFLSNRAIKPMEENLERQKQFVTNAGHDLKTPVAVILADTEVLQMTLGEDNEWLASIKRQAKKMDYLIKGLLSLSRAEGGKIKPQKEDFSLSNVIDEEIQDMRALANERSVKINYDKSELMVHADPALTRQALVILLDNAIKYTDEGGNIDVIANQVKKQVVVEVINDYSDYANFNPSRVFDRFYRGDKSRNSEKNLGYGIGLAMAKTIAESNGGKINVDITKECRVRFTMTLPA